MTHPILPSTGGDYVIRDGVLVPADAVTDPPPMPDAAPEPEPIPESASARKRRSALITDEE